MTNQANEDELKDRLTKLISQDGWVDNHEVDVEGQVAAIQAIIRTEKLKARIDELLHLDDESIGTDWKANAWFSVSDRIAELKQELEEL